MAEKHTISTLLGGLGYVASNVASDPPPPPPRGGGGGGGSAVGILCTVITPYAMVTPSRKAARYEPRKDIFAIWSQGHDYLVAVTGFTWQLRSLRGGYALRRSYETYRQLRARRELLLYKVYAALL